MVDAKSGGKAIASGNIVILTGAGISRESGLDTFRDAEGIWSKVNLEDVATPRGFARNPALVHDFYNARRRQLTSGAIHPNDAHRALARLQRLWKGQVLLVTQNIDDLHERGGSPNALHMHGELLKARCGRCQTVTPCTEDLSIKTRCPVCGVSAAMRPEVVWFGEIPMHMETIEQAVQAAALFLSIGTSGVVYPAAGLVAAARGAGAHTVELNLEPSLNASLFHESIHGNATQVVREYVANLLLPTAGGN